jgi:hypothetical protein
MRIVGEIPHPILKITIFLHDSRYSAKFEAGLYELTYKFRSGDALNSFEDIRAIIDETFIAQVLETLPQLNEHKLAALSRWRAGLEEEEFDTII